MARTGFFPGSTIGNFEPHEACAFLRHAGRMLGRGAALIIGVDLVKDAGILNAAYNDAAGVTAKFNLNLLARINRELGGRFRSCRASSHHAFYNRRAPPHRDAPRQQEAPEGQGGRPRRSNSAPARRSTPRTATNTRSNTSGALARGSGWTPGRGLDRRRRKFFHPRAGLRGRAEAFSPRAGRSEAVPTRLSAALTSARVGRARPSARRCPPYRIRRL